MAKDGRINYGVGIDNSELRMGAMQSKRILHDIGSSAVQEGNRIDNTMKNIGKAVAAAFTVQQLKEFGSQVVKVRGEFQQLEVAFKTMLGSADKADALMSQLIKTAATTPFGMTELAQASKQLIAYGVEGNKVNETLIRLGDIAAGLSIPVGDLAYLYGTTMVQGRLYTQDLNQFLGRGIPLTEELAKQFGVADSQVKQLVTDGKVGFEDVEKAIISLTSEGGKFGGLMEAQSQTIAGQISNIEDSIEQMFNEIGKKSEGFISETLSVTSSIVENWQNIGKALAVVLAGYGAYKTAVVTITMLERIKARVTAEAALQTKLAAMQGIALSNAQAMAAAKTAILSQAFNALKVAIMTNPIGLILGVVSSLAVAIGLFSENTTEASVAITKYGKSAAEQLNKVDTLTNIIKGATTASQTQKTAIEELNSILEEYGLQAIKEGESIDEVNKKREQAIELIKQEAIERQRANNLEQGAADYAAKVKAAQEQLFKDLAEAETGGQDIFGFVWSSENSEIVDNASAISAIISDVVQNNIDDITNNYDKGLEKVRGIVQERMRAIGISEKTISSTWWDDGFWTKTEVLSKFVASMHNAKAEYDNYTAAIEKNTEAERQASESSMTHAEKVAASESALKGASGKVDELYTNIKNLMSQYSENTIGFTIKFNAEVPEWMNSMDIPELQRLAARFTAIGKNSPNGSYVNGKYFTQQELLQHGADYAQAAKNKQDAADKKAREDEANKKKRQQEAEKAKRERERKEREQQKIKDETAERNEQIAEYTTSVAEQTKQSELEIRQARINMMQEGFEREMLQNKLNYDRLIAANEKRANDMKEALKDKMVLEWKNENPTTTKEQEIAYRSSIDFTDIESLTPEIKKELETINGIIKSYSDVAEEQRTKANKATLDAMLEDVLTYEQQRTKIADEYEAKRRQMYEINTDEKGNFKSYKTNESGNRILRSGVTQGNVDELNRQEQEALSAVDEQFASREEAYNAWCNEIANYTLEQLEATLKEAEAKLKQLQKDGASDNELATARAKVTTAKNAVSKAKAKNDVSPNKRSIKEWEDLYKTLNECEKQFEDIGDAVGGVAGEIISSAGEIMTSSLSMINGIVQLVNMSSTGMTATATAGAKAISTMEKASVILTIISAALQIAMKIANLFNDDEEKQEEIERLQGRIDQLQWELDHQEIIRLKDSGIDSLKLVRDTMIQIRGELVKAAQETNSWVAKLIASSVNISNLPKQLAKGANEIAKAYANVAYTADKALGGEKYENANEQLQNIAKQQIMMQEQIEAERSKKDTDDGKIQDLENKIKEKGAEAIAIINEMVDDIIGGNSVEIAEQLSDAFFEAFQNGEDAAEAWGSKVKEIVADILKRMLVSKFLEEPLGQIFDKYKKMWFKDGQFQGLDAVISSMQNFSNDLMGAGNDFVAIWESLPEEIKEYFKPIGEDAREAAEKGIATASQESIDELNGRMTAVQGHTFSISENTKLLVANTSLILQSVINIESNTEGLSERMAGVEGNLKAVKDTVNDIALRGIKIK